MKSPYAIGSVPSLSGHAIAYRWRSLPRVRRHRASKPQGSSERVLPWQITMDQLIFASLSHTHYWYELGMLKVPAVILYTYINRRAEPPIVTKHENNSAIEPYHNNICNLLVYSTIQCSTLVIILLLHWVWDQMGVYTVILPYSKKSLNASKPSEHAPDRGRKCQNAWLGGIIGCKDNTSSWHFVRYPLANAITTSSCDAECSHRRDLEAS